MQENILHIPIKIWSFLSKLRIFNYFNIIETVNLLGTLEIYLSKYI